MSSSCGTISGPFNSKTNYIYCALFYKQLDILYLSIFYNGKLNHFYSSRPPGLTMLHLQRLNVSLCLRFQAAKRKVAIAVLRHRNNILESHKISFFSESFDRLTAANTSEFAAEMSQFQSTSNFVKRFARCIVYTFSKYCRNRKISLP